MNSINQPADHKPADADGLQATLRHWQALAQEQAWEPLMRATAAPQPNPLRLTAALWQARLLRLQKQGETANQALLTAANQSFEATTDQLAEFIEELVQSAWYEEAAKLNLHLEKTGVAQADFIWVLLWREREDWPRCEAALVQLAARGRPWNQLAELQQAWAWLRQERSGLAAAHLQTWQTTSQPAVQKLLARLALVRGQYQTAAEYLQAVAKVQPQDWEWPPLLAVALAPSLVQSEPQRLLDLYAQGLAVQPRQAEALTNRASLLFALGQTSAAEEDLTAALAIKPWLDAPVLQRVQRALQKTDFVQAKAQLDAARAQCDTPRRAAASLDLLRMQPLNTETNQFTQRKTRLEQVEATLRKFPSAVPLLRSAGAALQHFKQFDRAAQCYAQALAVYPEDNATRNNLALLYRDRGDLEAAIDIWRKDGLDEADLTVQLNYAHCLLERGDRQEARQIFVRAQQSAPENPVALRGLAEVFYAAGEDDIAWEYACQALQAAPEQPLGWKTAAGIATRRQGSPAAIALLEQGLAYARPALPLRQALFNRWRGNLPPEQLQTQVATWCKDTPTEVEHWLMAADAAFDALDFATCEQHLRQAQAVELSSGSQALVRFYLGRAREGAARRVAEQLVRTEPNVMRHWGLLAEVLYRQERIDEALTAVAQGLKREPQRLSLVRLQVGFLLAQENFGQAIAIAQELVDFDPLPTHLSLLVEALQRGRQSARAVDVLQRALQQHTGQPSSQRQLCLMLATAQQRNGESQVAIDTLAALYADQPHNLQVVRHYIRALAGERRLQEAVTVARELLQGQPDQPDLQAAVSALLIEQGLHEEASAAINQALQHHPQHLDLWLQRIRIAHRADDAVAERSAWQAVMEHFAPRRWLDAGLDAFVRLKMEEELECALNQWREEEPGSIIPWWLAFRAAKNMKRFGQALALLEKIENKRGTHARIHNERANILQEQWRLSAAIEQARRAIELVPDSTAYREQLFNILVKAGDFSEFDELMARMQLLLGDRRYGHYRNFFFNINCHPTWSAEQIWLFYQDWYERAVKPGLPPVKPYSNTPDPQRRLRVGYLSPDFRRHAVAYFSEPLLIYHDREQFELFAYAHLDGGVCDAYTERFKSYVHHWVDITHLSDDELERRIHDDQIDILIDLAGHTANNRLAVMCKRPAPVQASWIWGAGQTTGLPQVDYLLTDTASIPPEHNVYLSEKPMRMSRPGLPFMPAHDVLEPTPLPCLKNGYITFGVLARPLRTNPQTIALWAQILHALPTAVLRFDHMPYAEADIQQRMSAAFSRHGIDAQRLLFLNTRPHWRVYQEIDIQLDPFPAGSATTASEGLFMDRLVITLQSRPPMGRITDGQLQALGLAVLCSATTKQGYVDKAVALASDLPRLTEYSHGLRERMQASWLMDYAGYARETAGLYRQMWETWCAGQGGAA